MDECVCVPGRSAVWYGAPVHSAAFALTIEVAYYWNGIAGRKIVAWAIKPH